MMRVNDCPCVSVLWKGEGGKLKVRTEGQRGMQHCGNGQAVRGRVLMR